LPWIAGAPSQGFGPGEASWLPQPSTWAAYARDVQDGEPGSTLRLYRDALGLRREHDLARQTLQWIACDDPETLAFRVGRVTVLANLGTRPVAAPDGVVLLASEALVEGPDGAVRVPGDTTVWLHG
jgi:alpha-glucosidase